MPGISGIIGAGGKSGSSGKKAQKAAPWAHGEPMSVPKGYTSWPEYYEANPDARGTGSYTSGSKPKKGGGGGGAGDMEEFINEAENDPFLERQAGRVEDRLENFGENTQQSIDMAVSDIRDQTEGRRQAMQGMLAARGIGGTGFEGAYERGLMSDEARAAARATSGMRIERDKDYDQFLLGSTGALGAPGAANRADRQLALQAWISANENRRAEESQEMDYVNSYLNFIDNVLGGAL